MRDVPAVVARVRALAERLGLAVDDVLVVQNSNKLTVRLLPCDVLARVAPVAHGVARFEIEVAARLASSGNPVAEPAPVVGESVHHCHDLDVTFWTYYGAATTAPVPPAEYARALERLHAGMRGLGTATPHFTDRAGQALESVADRDRTPELTGADRDLLGGVLRSAWEIDGRARSSQVLHGEPHPGNLLRTRNGLRFIDFETCCRGPVEFDLAHAPDEVAGYYPDVDEALLRDCRTLVLAMITTWRWERDDDLPDGRRKGEEGLEQLRALVCG